MTAINTNTTISLDISKYKMNIFRIISLTLIILLIIILILNINEVTSFQFSSIVTLEASNEIDSYPRLSIDELIQFGTIAANEKRYKSAVIFYDTALDKEPYNIDGLNGMGYVLTEQNRLDEARNYYDKTLALDTNNFNANNGYGYLLIKNNEFKKAIPFFTTILNIDEQNVNALNGLGLSYVGLGDYSKALEIFQTSLSINPEKIETINGIAFTYYRDGQYDKSETNYRKVLDKSENNLDALRGLAIVLMLQDKSIETKLHLTSIHITKSTIIQMVNEGNYLITIGEYDNASKLFEEVIIADPNNVEALYGKAMALKELGQYMNMEYFANRILDLDSQHSGAIFLKSITPSIVQ